MSYSEMINFESIALQVKATCTVAQKSLDRIDEMLKQMHTSAKSLITEKIKAYEAYLLKEKADIISQMEDLKKNAEIDAKKGTQRIYGQNNAIQSKSSMFKAGRLLTKVDDFVLSKSTVLNQMINDELINIANNSQQQLMNAARGIISLPDQILKQLEGIEDITLREAVYRVAIEIEHQGKPFEQLIELGQEKLKELTENLLERHKQTILEGIRRDMEASRVDASTINQTLNSNNSIQEIRAQATNEIVGEEVRKESLKIILKAIETRGFIVDRKNSIKINKDKNEVLVIGKKASGQTAEFKIYLDGRFSYKFDGFEGQACQKDIEPFMNDLEEIYGMKITGRLELWKNPDKLSSQKYQTYNTNKGKN
jgi:hypothetical protein